MAMFFPALNEGFISSLPDLLSMELFHGTSSMDTARLPSHKQHMGSIALLHPAY